MTIIVAVLDEFRKMFLADIRLSAGLLAVVALAGAARTVAPGLAPGAVLLAGALAVLVAGVLGTRVR